MTNTVKLTQSLLAGMVAFSIFMLFITWLEAPAYDEAAVVVFIWIAVSGIIGYDLLSKPTPVAFGISIFTGMLAVGFFIALLTEILGMAPGVPHAVEGYLTLSYAGLGGILIIVIVVGLTRSVGEHQQQ